MRSWVPLGATQQAHDDLESDLARLVAAVRADARRRGHEEAARLAEEMLFVGASEEGTIPLWGGNAKVREYTNRLRALSGGGTPIQE